MLRTLIAATALLQTVSAFASLSPSFSRTVRGPMSLRGGMAEVKMSAAPPTTSTPKLVYFDARGVVEPTRLLLAAAGVEYDDHRYKVDMATRSAPEFQAEKESGALAVNMGRAPILEIDGQQIGQSHAIARYLAKKHGMMGGSELEAAQIDTIYEHVRDIKDMWVKVRVKQESEEEKKTSVNTHLTQDLPQWCSKLESALRVFGGSDGFAVGSALSLADVAVYAWLSCCYPAEHADAVKAAYAECSRISAIVERAGSNDGIKKWEAERPDTVM